MNARYNAPRTRAWAGANMHTSTGCEKRSRGWRRLKIRLAFIASDEMRGRLVIAAWRRSPSPRLIGVLGRAERRPRVFRKLRPGLDGSHYLQAACDQTDG